MKCSACGCYNRWVDEDICPVNGHPNVEVKFKICECGNEQEDLE